MNIGDLKIGKVDGKDEFLLDSEDDARFFDAFFAAAKCKYRIG